MHALHASTSCIMSTCFSFTAYADTPNPPPQARASQLAWQAALSRASGEKVLDDPKLLRRSIKRDAKQKARNTKKWEERSSAQAEAQAARQDK